MTIKTETFWYTIYECDLCGDETDDPFIDDEGDDLCGKCAQNFSATLGLLIANTELEKLRSRKRILPVLLCK